MLQTYQKYLVKSFLTKIFNVMSIFFLLILILNIFEEISFFKELKINFFFIIFLTVLNIPSLLFTIFPFIFLISSLLFFLDLVNKNELEILKVNGLNNLKIIKILFFTSLIAGIFLSLIFYNISAKLKFVYLELKNNYSTDNKYLAMVTENGIWIKDEFNEDIYIINAKKIEGIYLKDVLISEFSNEFVLTRVIKSNKVDISDDEWLVYDPSISVDNVSLKTDDVVKLKTHFNIKKINELFSDLYSLNIFELFKLSYDYKKLGYATAEVRSHINKILSFPVYLSIMTVFSAIIMLNIKKDKPMIFYLILSIFISVMFYYFNYMFNLMGINGKFPVYVGTWMPLLLLTIIIFIGLIRIDEK